MPSASPAPSQPSSTADAPGPTPEPPAAGRPMRHRVRRTLSVALVALLALVALSGCARVQVALAVQPDDTVNGDVVVATPDGAPTGKGPQLSIPPDLAGDVEISPYQEDGYVGSKVSFSGLTFEQVGRLGEVAGIVGARGQLQLRRLGSRLVVQGRADLSTVPVDRADFQLKMSFPGDVLETNGDPDGSTVSWSFTPGEVTQINAAVSSTDPNAPSTVGWTLLLAALVVIASAAAVVLARRNRNPPVRHR